MEIKYTPDGGLFHSTLTPGWWYAKVMNEGEVMEMDVSDMEKTEIERLDFEQQIALLLSNATFCLAVSKLPEDKLNEDWHNGK